MNEVETGAGEWTRAELLRLPECAPERVPLGAWFALPLSREEAEALAAAARRAANPRRDAAYATDLPRLAALIAAFWRGGRARDEYRSLRATARAPRMRALVDLVYGQLLISRRLRGAHVHLQAGFHAAVPWLGAAEYFRVLQRHECLGHLVLGDEPAPPACLAELLREARVVRMLAKGRAAAVPADCRMDTIG